MQQSDKLQYLFEVELYKMAGLGTCFSVILKEANIFSSIHLKMY